MKKHFYGCVSKIKGPLGYVQADTITEARELAKNRWPELTDVEVHRWDGVL